MTRTHLARATAAVALTCALVAGTAATSFAAGDPQPTGTSTAGAASGDVHRNVCARATHAERRVERALARIQGDAQQKGSIAWLEARAAEADQAGRTERAAALRARADRREVRVPELQAAQERLEAAITAHCSTATAIPTPPATS
jgi:hypothetical protein